MAAAQHVCLLWNSVTRAQASLDRNMNCMMSEALIDSKVRWDVTSCNVEDRSYRRFGRISCFHLQGDTDRREKVSLPSIIQLSPQLLMFRQSAYYVILHTPEPAGKIGPHISPHINNSLFDPKLLYRSSHSDTLCHDQQRGAAAYSTILQANY